MKNDDIDGGREFDWGRTSEEYAAYRQGYPPAFYAMLQALGIGTPEQRILDLGTGTGVLARAFAGNGATVVGVDVADNQIAQARRLAEEQGLEAIFSVCAAEDIDFADASFDVVCAAQAWMYFDVEVVIPKILRVLTESGQLVLTYFSWLPFKDATARQSEALVLRYNPGWSGANYTGYLPQMFPWAKGVFDLKSFHVAEVAVPFTRDGWRGRLRACRGVGAELTQAEIERFDAEHAQLLAEIVAEEFTILHQMSVHAYVRKGALWPDQSKHPDFKL